MKPYPRIIPFGDRGIVIEYENNISEQCNRKVKNLYHVLKQASLTGVVSLIPTYRSLLVKYDPLAVAYDDIMAAIAPFANQKFVAAQTSDMVEIPVLYGRQWGEDLEEVARISKKSPDEVVKTHCSVDYTVYMIGFLVGFPYLGKVPQSINVPRLATPRIAIPAGSVGIAGSQTGIYPIEAPGGWRLLGRTPVKLFDLGRKNPVLLNPDQKIRFRPIDPTEYNDLCAQVEAGIYQPRYITEERT